VCRLRHQISAVAKPVGASQTKAHLRLVRSA
jgi:hypothetical protein